VCPHPTITGSGRVGHACAPAPAGTESNRSTAARNLRVKLMGPSGGVM
jgi:hypothetical protein